MILRHLYVAEAGKSCPTEILEAIQFYQCGRKTYLETDAYAADVPNA